MTTKTAPKFLQRLAFAPVHPVNRTRAAIVQYHPAARPEFARKHHVGYVIAYVEPWAEAHGASLAAGPEALDILDRLVAAYDNLSTSVLGDTPLPRLIGEARALVARCTPPAGSVNPNGTPSGDPRYVITAPSGGRGES